MTPIELGLLGAGLIFFAVPSLGTRPLWTATVGVSLVGAILSLGGGNLFFISWSPWMGHLSGLVGTFATGGSPQYVGGHLGGTFPAADFKFLSFLLFSLAGIAFLRGGYTGYEPVLISLVAVVAGLLTFSVDNLVLLYLGLELQALCLYTLVGFFKFQEERTDSALKYLLSGSLVSGFMLLGFARWYGQNGGLHMFEFTQWDSLGSAWVIGVLLFKVGAAPFHFWTPVVYTPLEWGTLGFTLGAAKVNIWYLLIGPLREALHQGWWPTWVAGLLSVLVGSVGGFFQTSLGGLLAYSGVVNGGYLLLLGIATTDTNGSFSFGYYAVVYLIGTLTLLGIVSVWKDTRFGTDFPIWGKLGVGVPLLVYYLTLNLGGLPVFPGFFAKLILLKGLSGFGFFLLWGLVAASIIPAVYYVSVGVAALFEPSSREVTPPAWLHPVVVALLVLGFNGVTTLLLTM
jgi:NADH-quinone oxidoreductase subunit N